jgi:hypothetical protein
MLKSLRPHFPPPEEEEAHSLQTVDGDTESVSESVCHPHLILFGTISPEEQSLTPPPSSFVIFSGAAAGTTRLPSKTPLQNGLSGASAAWKMLAQAQSTATHSRKSRCGIQPLNILLPSTDRFALGSDPL